jgi:hydrogenase nickel incorporation protein HypA/HybF
MHEMALAEGILAVVLEVADGHPVKEVRVRAGALQRIVPESLQFCFELAAAGTSAAEATVTVDETPAVILCHECQAKAELTTPPFMCGRCGGSNVEYLAGDELMVDGVELDTGWLHRPGAYGGDPVTANVPAAHLDQHASAEAAGLPHHQH